MENRYYLSINSILPISFNINVYTLKLLLDHLRYKYFLKLYKIIICYSVLFSGFSKWFLKRLQYFKVIQLHLMKSKNTILSIAALTTSKYVLLVNEVCIKSCIPRVKLGIDIFLMIYFHVSNTITVHIWRPMIIKEKHYSERYDEKV